MLIGKNRVYIKKQYNNLTRKGVDILNSFARIADPGLEPKN